MLYKVFAPGDWFAPKRYGFGAGLPIAWQGWALLVSYLSFVLGLGLAFELGRIGNRPAALAGLVAITAVFLMICARRTRGGWRWRWGEGS
jgi:hypothetical protein